MPLVWFYDLVGFPPHLNFGGEETTLICKLICSAGLDLENPSPFGKGRG
jgi:hypothetical protein